jgi:DNA-binding PucR family transcriptional regulator
VQYRLSRLELLSNLSLQRTEDRLTLELALRILDVLDNQSAFQPNGERAMR